MRRILIFLWILSFAAVATAGFRAKKIRPKKPQQFQAYITVSGVTFASDLLLNGEEQKSFFSQELTPNSIVALRLAIINSSRNEIALPLEGIRLVDPEGKEVPAIKPEMVSQAVLQGYRADSEEDRRRAQLAIMKGSRDARTDRSNPTYDPRRDPTDPNYDPRTDTANPNYSPQTDPTNPAYVPRDASSTSNSQVKEIRTNQININPEIFRGRSEDPAVRGRMIEKDFIDKAYWGDPVLPSMKCDRFLYFVMGNRPPSVKGFELRLSPRGSSQQPLILKFK